MPKFLVNVDLNQNEIQNVSLQKLTTAPSNPTKGQVYYNTVDNRSYYWNGSQWMGMDSVGASMTGDNIIAAINGTTSSINGERVNFGGGIAAATEKTTPVDADTTVISDSAASGATKKLSWENIKATLKTYFDTLYNNYTHPNHSGDVTSTGDGATVIANKAVTLAKMADIATNSILGRKTAASGEPEVLSKADVLALLNVQDGAQVNTVASVAGKTGAVTLAKGDVGLGNVTNDAQVKKSATSVDGNIPVWSGTSGDALGAGYGVETTLAGGNDKIPRADAVKNYIDGLLAASDAMVFKGTLGTGGTITALPTTYSAGWSYKIITAGTYAGAVCEVGDLIIATVDRAGSGNLNSDWVVVQTNIDGAVTGPASATDGNFPLFDGTTGKLIKNSAYGPSSFSAANHNHDATYTKKYTTTLGGATSQVVTHNLNTRDVSVTIRETNSPYAVVLTDIELTTVNTLTVSFAVAPAADAYTITVIG